MATNQDKQVKGQGHKVTQRTGKEREYYHRMGLNI